MAVPRAERPWMPDYGVPQETDGLLDWSWAEERLQRSRSYWVVTVSAAGRPHAMPVWGIWRSDRNRFAFSCAPSARKARNLAANPRVCVGVDDTVECVSVEGVAAPLKAGADRRDVAVIFADKYCGPEPEQSVEMIEFLLSNAMYEVTPERAFGIIEREEEFAARATRWVF